MLVASHKDSEITPSDGHPHGQRLTVHLQGRVVNVSALERATGLDQSYLSKVLSGKKHPRAANLQLIADALGMTPGQFIDAIAERNQ